MRAVDLIESFKSYKETKNSKIQDITEKILVLHHNLTNNMNICIEMANTIFTDVANGISNEFPEDLEV